MRRKAAQPEPAGNGLLPVQSRQGSRPPQAVRGLGKAPVPLQVLRGKVSQPEAAGDGGLPLQSSPQAFPCVVRRCRLEQNFSEWDRPTTTNNATCTVETY